MPNVLSSPVGGLHWTKHSPILGVITMLPALSPTQTVSLSDGSTSASPDWRIQWHRYRASPPATSRTSVSRSRGTQCSSSMLGSAVSSSTPTDFQPRSTIGFSECPLMNCHALTPGPAMGCPYIAVGMHTALESAIGLPSSSTRASRMLVLVTPPDVRRSFTRPPGSSAMVGPTYGPGPAAKLIAVDRGKPPAGEDAPENAAHCPVRRRSS